MEKPSTTSIGATILRCNGNHRAQETRTCANDDPSDPLARLACQLYGLGFDDKFASASSENDTFLNVNGLVLCILCSGSNFTGGLGTTRMCENGSFLAARFTGAGGGGPPELALVVELALRDVRPFVVQGNQQFLFWSRCTL